MCFFLIRNCCYMPGLRTFWSPFQTLKGLLVLKLCFWSKNVCLTSIRLSPKQSTQYKILHENIYTDIRENTHTLRVMQEQNKANKRGFFKCQLTDIGKLTGKKNCGYRLQDYKKAFIRQSVILWGMLNDF